MSQLIKKIGALLNRPGLSKLLDFICDVVIKKETGKLECNFSQGAITKKRFTKDID